MKNYLPFLYPPDYQIAVIHHNASRPGQINPSTSIKCSCCNQMTKQPLQSWINRSIDHDFQNYGGAVVTYFWLVKLYAFISLLVLLLYSTFLFSTIMNQCPKVVKEQTPCANFIGVWIVTNQNLYTLMDKHDKDDLKARILTLRSIAFAILMIGNTLALYVSGRFKRRHPQPKNISNFSLLFKNADTSVQNLAEELQKQYENISIKQMFKIKKFQPYYTSYNQKIQTYYSCLVELNLKKKKKLFQKLLKNENDCAKTKQLYKNDSDRIIIVFQSQREKQLIQTRYELKGLAKLRYLLGFDQTTQEYCEQCPIPEQIIWSNIGQHERQKLQLKVLSVLYFLLLIGSSYFILYFCMKFIYKGGSIGHPWDTIITNIIVTLMVPMALTFRALMNKLSQMRLPNTQTHRTLFIVITTVLFHFLHYIIIPTFYLFIAQKYDNDKYNSNKILLTITNQTFNFLIVQFILAGTDFIYRIWHKNLKKVMNQYKPIGCQKILHQQIQFPRFPIEFKLIILFKTFSFIILFAFQSPFILFIGFVLLIFLYYSDKYAVYRHYRMQIIDNGVQFKFLKVYSLFFSLYTFLIYGITQKFQDKKIEFYAALTLTIVLVFFQIFIIRDRVYKDQSIPLTTLSEAKISDSYKQRFHEFEQNITNDQIDTEITQYLSKLGHVSIQTQTSLKERLLT